MSDQTLDSPPPPPLPDQPPPSDSSSSLPDQPPPSDSSSSSSSLSRNSSFSKLNAQAPEFVPKKSVTPPPPPPPLADPRVIIVPPPPPPPVHLYPPPPPQVNSPFPVVPLPHLNHPHPHHHHPHQHHQDHHHHNQHQHQHHRNHHHHQKHHHQDNQQDKEQGQGSNNNNGGSKNNNNNSNNNSNGLSDESTQKLINQVEYYFSDVNLATTDHLIKFINKDIEGFVPISVVASFKKIKALISSNSQLAAVLKNSTKLVVSEDGKKVKRLHPLTGSDMEELQARIIVAENLPEDHCHQNLMRVFSTVGSVKSIRTCQPQPSNNGASSASRPSKTDNMHYCNKLHAFVEYESIELAEKAITELNDENNWRNGLRVRPLVKHGSKSGQPRGKKSGNEGEVTCEEEDASASEQKQNEKPAEDPSGQPGVNSHDQGDEQNLEKEGGQKKGRNRGRAKGRGRGNHSHNHNHQNNRGHHVGSPPVNNAINGEHPIGAKQQPPGPRMPDGTRGFSMGRGRPVAVNTTA